LGTAIFGTLFGLSENFAFAIVTRSLCGLVNGNTGVVKSMLGEMTDETNRGRAFSYWEASFGIGTIVGPMLGGLLVDPAHQYPSLFGGNAFFLRFPYFLPCFVGSLVSFIGAIIGLFYMEETRKVRRIRLPKNDSEGIKEPRISDTTIAQRFSDYRGASFSLDLQRSSFVLPDVEESRPLLSTTRQSSSSTIILSFRETVFHTYIIDEYKGLYEYPGICDVVPSDCHLRRSGNVIINLVCIICGRTHESRRLAV
jgi:MFS family permease